jgi:hypothetical protein
MPKRNLRIVKRAANIPVLGVCEYCNAQFSADPTGRTVEGQSTIQEQFDKHKCEREDASQATTGGANLTRPPAEGAAITG